MGIGTCHKGIAAWAALVAAVLALMLPAASVAAITTPTWMVDAELPGDTVGARPFSSFPGAVVPLSDGGYTVASVYPVPFGMNEYSASGVYRRTLAGGGFAAAGVEGVGQSRDAVQASDGTLWITDQAFSRVEHRAADGTLLDTVGSLGGGSADGEFANPVGIAVAPDGTLLVADTGNNRIQRLTSAGLHLATYGSSGGGPGQFGSPASIAVAPDGSFFVSDADNNRVQHLDADGTFLDEWGSAGSADGEFNNPIGIT